MKKSNQNFNCFFSTLPPIFTLHRAWEKGEREQFLKGAKNLNFKCYKEVIIIRLLYWMKYFFKKIIKLKTFHMKKNYYFLADITLSFWNGHAQGAALSLKLEWTIFGTKFLSHKLNRLPIVKTYPMHHLVG